jgi:hypothetical protein
MAVTLPDLMTPAMIQQLGFLQENGLSAGKNIGALHCALYPIVTSAT